MKVVILAGGLGSRLQEETTVRPKPLVEIGGKPILWHILQLYSAHGFNEFIVALGYKGEAIKEYFLNFHALNNNLTVDLSQGTTHIHEGNHLPNWRIHLVDTGQDTLTGGRIKRLQPWIGNETFLATYGDGLSDVPIGKLVEFHRSHGKIATLTAVRPPARFGSVHIQEGQVVEFVEKPSSETGWINGGFFVLEPQIFDYIEGDRTPFEWAPMQRLATDAQLMAYQHDGFFQPMDTMRDKRILEEMWESGQAPWKVWKS